MLERSTQRGCCRFKVNRGEGAHDYFLPLSLSRRRDIAVLIYLFRDEATDNVALTIDVTGQNIPSGGHLTWCARLCGWIRVPSLAGWDTGVATTGEMPKLGAPAS